MHAEGSAYDPKIPECFLQVANLQPVIRCLLQPWLEQLAWHTPTGAFSKRIRAASQVWLS